MVISDTGTTASYLTLCIVIIDAVNTTVHNETYQTAQCAVRHVARLDLGLCRLSALQ